jgi:SET domain-containing protein
VNIVPSNKIYISKSAIPNAGRGVFASSDIKKGTVIEVCPVILIPKSEVPSIQQTLLINYNFSWGKAYEARAICLGFGSLYNHAYEPNATYRKNMDTLTIEFISLKNIQKGEEITVNYHGGDPDDKSPIWMKDVPLNKS